MHLRTVGETAVWWLLWPSVKVWQAWEWWADRNIERNHHADRR